MSNINMQEVYKIGLPGTPATVVSTKSQNDLVALQFMNRKVIAGHIVREDQNYITFNNFLTNETTRYAHSTIAAIHNDVSVHTQVVDLSAHKHFNTQHRYDKTLHRTSHIITYSNQTVSFVDTYIDKQAQLLASVDNYS